LVATWGVWSGLAVKELAPVLETVLPVPKLLLRVDVFYLN